MESIKKQLQNAGVVINPADRIYEQLKDFPATIQEAARLGYISGQAFRRTRVKEAPYASDTREYRFWNRAFDCAMFDSKSGSQK